MSFKEKIDLNRLPQHIAIIMDGNGRWASKQGHDRIFGHEHGVDAVRDVAEASAELGIGYLTVYTFSTENWKRPELEVKSLMTLFVETIRKEIDTLNKNNIRLNAIGDLKSLPEENYLRLMETIEETSKNDRMVLTLALSYSSRWEITEAVKRIINKQKTHNYTAENITEELVAQHLNTSDLPDPELLIRTSGEMRISNYLLWQIAYSELYFTPVLWPDFTKESLYEAIVDYQSRERRFGMTSEQLKS
jgi:undecaprenyl diphosphate synthase